MESAGHVGIHAGLDQHQREHERGPAGRPRLFETFVESISGHLYDAHWLKYQTAVKNKKLWAACSSVGTASERVRWNA